MPTGFINIIVRRATLRTILLALAILVIIVTATLPALNYYRNILTGPYEVAAKDLDAIDDISTLDNYFLAIHSDEAFDTGGAIIHTYGGIELYRDNFTVVSLGDRLLLVETSRDPNSLDYSGTLKPIPPRMQLEVIDAAIAEDPRLKDAFYTFMLDEGIMGSTFRLTGFIIMGIVVVSFGWSFLVLGRAFRWMGDPTKHPIVVGLGRYGELTFVGREIERELQIEQEHIGNVHFTRNWVVYRGATRLAVARLNDIMWVYPYQYTQYVYGIPVYRKREVYVWDRHGTRVEFPARKKDVSAIMEAILHRAPWAAGGYSAQFEQSWRTNRSDFIASVEKRRQENIGNA